MQEKVVEDIKQLVDQNGGSIYRQDNWGIKTLAYPINKKTKALYMLLGVKLPSSAVPPMQQPLRVNDNILRYLLMRENSSKKKAAALSQAVAEVEKENGETKIKPIKKGKSKSAKSKKK